MVLIIMRYEHNSTDKFSNYCPKWHIIKKKKLNEAKRLFGIHYSIANNCSQFMPYIILFLKGFH